MKGLALLILTIGLVTSCTRTPREDEPLARVNSRIITVREFNEAFSYLKPKEMSLNGQARAETKNLVLKSLIRRSVILTAAEKSKISLSDAELEAGLKNFKEGYTSQSFEQSLLDQMVDAEEWKNRVRQNLLIEKLFESSTPRIKKPTVKEALQYYEEHPSLYHKDAEVAALHLIVSDPKLADDLRQKLKKNPKQFKALAKANSMGPEAQEDAMIRVTQGTLTAELDRVLFEARIGELSPVIKSPYGFHIFRIVQRTHAINLDFDQVKDDIFKTLVLEDRRKWILDFEEELIRTAQIEYNRDLISRL